INNRIMIVFLLILSISSITYSSELEDFLLLSNEEVCKKLESQTYLINYHKEYKFDNFAEEEREEVNYYLYTEDSTIMESISPDSSSIRHEEKSTFRFVPSLGNEILLDTSKHHVQDGHSIY